MKIIIVGGVAGGASCAARLRRWRPEQLPLPTHTITVDLISGLRGGQGIRRRRSCNYREHQHSDHFQADLSIDGQALVDGGLIDNVPADVLTRKD